MKEIRDAPYEPVRLFSSKLCVLASGNNSKVTKSHPKGDDDIKLSID